MTCEHCQSKHNAMLMARDNAEAFKAERDRVRQEALTRIDALAADNDRLRAEVESEKTLYAVTRAGAEVFRDAYTELREATAKLSAGWREKARQLRNYDVGMHEVVNCADELDAALAKPTP